MKVQIAIVSRQMIMGGVERALIAMLNQFNYDDVDVDLYVEKDGGELFAEIPEKVNVSCLLTVNSQNIINYPVAALRKLLCKSQLKKEGISYLKQNKISSEMLIPIRKKYDIAIAYHAPNTVPMFYVIDKIQAKKKILWLHGNMESNDGDNPLAIEYHRKYDKVFAVSQSVYESFLKYHPDMKKQTEVFYNYVDLESIKHKVETGETYHDGFKGVRILTIGRLAEQKGLDLAIKVCKRLIGKGYSIRWYICGEGEGRNELEKMISENHLQEHFILLGNQDNPYRFLYDCDLYVQPSRCEGFCTTTNEARILCKPVITTDVSGAREQFVDGVTGWIVPIDIEEILKKVEWCIQYPEQLKEITNNLKMMKFQTSEAIDKIFE